VSVERKWFNTLTPRWPTVGCLYIIVYLVMLDRTHGVINPIPLQTASIRQYECDHGRSNS